MQRCPVSLGVRGQRCHPVLWLMSTFPGTRCPEGAFYPAGLGCVGVITLGQVDSALVQLILSPASFHAYGLCPLNAEPVGSGILGIQQRATPEHLFTWERNLVAKKGQAGPAGLHLPEAPALK